MDEREKRGRHRILRIVWAVLACVLFFGSTVCRADTGRSLELTEEERAFIEESGVLKVGYVQDRIPVSFRDDNGELAGISRYIFDRIAGITGLDFQYVPLPGGAVTYEYLMSEQIGLVTSVEYNKANRGARGIMISEPYFSSRKVIVGRRDFTYSPDAALSVALCSGSQTIKKVLNEEFPNYTIQDYDTIGECFQAVDRGEADMMLLNQYVVEYWLHKPAYENLKVIPVLGLDDQLCFSAVVPFDAEGNPVGNEGDLLISILDKAIDCIGADEVDSYTIQANMENRYTLTLTDILYRYRYAVIALSAAFVLIVTLAVMLMRQRLLSLEAKADARAKSEFLSTMSHEIRTPLNGLIGLNYLMTCRLHDPQQLARYLEQSTTTAKYLLSLVSDILDMSMLHNEDVQLEKKPMDLRVLLSTVEAIVQSSMDAKGLRFQVSGDLPYPEIVGDGVRIQQVMLNLLDNARKFTPEGGEVRLTVSQTREAGGRVCTKIDVADTGRGMSEAFQKNIFDAFAQERDTVSKGDQGVGLGLSISHRLAKLMEGELVLTSEPGKGSVFTFTFPAEQSALPEESRESSAPEQGERPKILVAEDNELNGEIMLDLLEESHFRAELAADGRIALQIFSDSQIGEYGVILMDLLMPEMDGYETAAAIRDLPRADAKTVKIFACSANCTVEDRERAFACGMDDFLAKPVDVDVLLEKLNH